MVLVLAIMAVLWGIGALMGAPKPARYAMIAVLFAAVLLIQLTLPGTSSLRTATGGSVQPWAILAIFGGLGLGYGSLLRAIRRRTAPTPKPQSDTFRDVELTRYTRHIVLREIGGLGQKKLKSAKVLVIGAGGLGSPALLYLAAAGVGTIGVVDDDTVDGSNLQRQIIHTDATIGMPKVFSAQTAMTALNPFITVRPYNQRLSDETATVLFAEYDLILDGSDNFDTRYMVNRLAVMAQKPLIAAAITQWEGQISVYDTASGGPCFQCVFPERPAEGLAPDCAAAGVIAPLPGVIGAMMALEAIKLICGAGASLVGRLAIYDALFAETRTIGVKPRAECPICGPRAQM
jgi:molybdopterin/thiamine biosynthesis adenylyltransferase